MTCLRSACKIFLIVVVMGVAFGQEQQKPKGKYYSESKVVDGELPVSAVLAVSGFQGTEGRCTCRKT